MDAMPDISFYEFAVDYVSFVVWLSFVLLVLFLLTAALLYILVRLPVFNNTTTPRPAPPRSTAGPSSNTRPTPRPTAWPTPLPNRIAVRTVKCLSCDEQFDDIPEVPHGCRSKHDSIICRECWEGSLKAQLDLLHISEIHCVHPNCRTKLSQTDFRALASAESLQRYLTLELKTQIPDDIALVWCLAPECTYGQVHEDGNIFKCIACGFRQCVACNVAWHAGLTCEQAAETRRDAEARHEQDEGLSTSLLARKSKICPGPGCGRRIMKNGGCNHMTCSLCHYEFCWICLADYRRIRREGNHYHERHCKDHSDRLPSYRADLY